MLKIKGFEKRVMEMESDKIAIRFATETDSRYILGIDSALHYKVAIDKEENEYRDYGVWIWDVERNMTYPMSIEKENLVSIKDFKRYLEGIIKMADGEHFAGSKGNTQKF